MQTIILGGGGGGCPLFWRHISHSWRSTNNDTSPINNFLHGDSRRIIIPRKVRKGDATSLAEFSTYFTVQATVSVAPCEGVFSKLWDDICFTGFNIYLLCEQCIIAMSIGIEGEEEWVEINWNWVTEFSLWKLCFQQSWLRMFIVLLLITSNSLKQSTLCQEMVNITPWAIRQRVK